MQNSAQPSRYAISKQLLKDSWKILKMDKEILWYPVITGLFSLFVLGVFIFAGWQMGVGKYVEGVAGESSLALSKSGYLLAGVYYLLSSVMATYFACATTAFIYKRLKGENPRLKDGFDAANQRLGKIVSFGLFTGTVGLVLRALEERSGLLGRIFFNIVGFAWTLATIFIAPVIILKDLGMMESIKDSARTFKKAWGETAIGSIGIALAGFVFMLPALFPAVILTAISGGNVAVMLIGFILTIVMITIVALVLSVCSSIYKTALYVYADTGIVPHGFDAAILQQAVVHKKHKI